MKCEYCSFTVIELLNAIDNLNLNKASGCDGLYVAAIKYCHLHIIPILQYVFSACCKHGFVSQNFCLIVRDKIAPVPKKNGMCNEYEDIHPITIVNYIRKLFEHFLADLRSVLISTNYKFGF